MGGLWLLNVKEVVEAGKRVVAARAARARALQQCKEAAEKKGENILGLMNTQMQLLAEVKGAVVPLTEVGNHSGAAPLPRKFHAACSLYPWRPLFVVFGGWRTGPPSSCTSRRSARTPRRLTSIHAIEPSRLMSTISGMVSRNSRPHRLASWAPLRDASARRADVCASSWTRASSVRRPLQAEIRVFVPELGTTETLRTSRVRRCPGTAPHRHARGRSSHRRLPSGGRGRAKTLAGDVDADAGTASTSPFQKPAEGEVPTVDISLQRNMLYGSYRAHFLVDAIKPHAPHISSRSGACSPRGSAADAALNSRQTLLRISAGDLCGPRRVRPALHPR